MRILDKMSDKVLIVICTISAIVVSALAVIVVCYQRDFFTIFWAVLVVFVNSIALVGSIKLWRKLGRDIDQSCEMH